MITEQSYKQILIIYICTLGQVLSKFNRVRERRRAEGEESSDEDDSPLSGLWRQDKERERERRRSRSRDRKRRSRERSGERKGQRREEESRRGRRRSRERSRDRKADERPSGPGLRLVDY